MSDKPKRRLAVIRHNEQAINLTEIAIKDLTTAEQDLKAATNNEETLESELKAAYSAVTFLTEEFEEYIEKEQLDEYIEKEKLEQE